MHEISHIAPGYPSGYESGTRELTEAGILRSKASVTAVENATHAAVRRLLLLAKMVAVAASRQHRAGIPPLGGNSILRCESRPWVLLLATLAVLSASAPAASLTRCEIAAKNISLTLSLEGGCHIAALTVGDRQLLAPRDGATTGFALEGSQPQSRLTLQGTPQISQQDGTTTVTGIHYSHPQADIRESWHFTAREETITWTIERDVSSALTLAELNSPRLVLRDPGVFDAALLDNGGSAWFRMLDATPSALGQNAAQATYWKRGEPWCLTIAADSPGGHTASRFAREADGRISQTIYAAPAPPVFKHLPGINLTRFIRQRTDVFAPAALPAGRQVVTIRFSARQADALYGRGRFSFISPETLTTIGNTIARVGVIDRHLMGGNNYHTGFVCLHEQYIADLGLFIDDPEYFEAYRLALDYFRDHALQPGGRVKPRFDYGPGDHVPGTFDKNGFYECQWGFLLDSQPDFVINVCSLFAINGDRPWLATHKAGCEKALDYLLARDTDADGLVEMRNASLTEQQSSDWIDIVWASHENAFVNAELYHALRLWSHCEHLLGDAGRAASYTTRAAQLKAGFNQDTRQGGFWEPAKKCYIYWREKDGSIHGSNTVIPVNFMAIAYGICDDPARIAAILDQIENQTAAEKLFFWPLCLTSFEYDEVCHRGTAMWPFPGYENGDLFLSWGGLGVEAYARYKPDLALKYVRQVLGQYEQDGLAFQRYLRVNQQGAGDDILSGNALIFTGLYRAIFGIQPKYNRLYLDPHVTPEVEGSEVRYRLRGREFRISYGKDGTTVTVGNASVASRSDFGVWVDDDGAIRVFLHDSETPTLVQRPATRGAALSVKIDATGAHVINQ
jgi:hypothetical protein